MAIFGSSSSGQNLNTRYVDSIMNTSLNNHVKQYIYMHRYMHVKCFLSEIFRSSLHIPYDTNKQNKQKVFNSCLLMNNLKDTESI